VRLLKVPYLHIRTPERGCAVVSHHPASRILPVQERRQAATGLAPALLLYRDSIARHPLWVATPFPSQTTGGLGLPTRLSVYSKVACGLLIPRSRLPFRSAIAAGLRQRHDQCVAYTLLLNRWRAVRAIRVGRRLRLRRGCQRSTTFLELDESGVYWHWSAPIGWYGPVGARPEDGGAARTLAGSGQRKLSHYTRYPDCTALHRARRTFPCPPLCAPKEPSFSAS
jgi:hypothetical protein